MSASNIRYQRVLIKLSGQALSGHQHFGIDPKTIDQYAKEIAEIVGMGVQVGIVIGGGNFFRGAELAQAGIERITADQIGMLGTLMNCLGLRDALERINIAASIMSALPMFGVCDPFDRRKAIEGLKQKSVILFAGGTGNPLFTTDTCASLRAIETNCDLLIKATNVDGIYDADPRKNENATLINEMTFDEVIERKVKVMDLSAFCQCQEHCLDIIVCNVHNPGTLKKVVLGEKIGTRVFENK
jgi:uridylate kinase